MRFHRGYMVGFLLLAIIIIALPLTIYIAQKPQHTQQQAAGGGTALLVSPHSRDSNPGTQTTPQGAGGGNALYVSPSGRDSNPGTQTAPFATIEKADSVATPGTTVHVLTGIYTWNGVYTTHSGTATAPITFISDMKWGAKLIPASVSSYSHYNVWHAKGDYVYIIGFDIKGPPGVGTLDGIALEGSFGKIIGNKVHDIDIHATCANGGNGIYIWGHASHDDDIIGNLVYNIVSAPADICWENHGIYYSQTGGHISNNIVYNVGAGWGIHCWHACSGVTITNNLVFNNEGGIVFGGGDNPNFANSLCDHMVVANNIAVNNTRSPVGIGISEYEYEGQHTIGSHNQILNNLIYGNPGGNMALLEGNTASGTVTSDAQFVNYQQDGSGDYHLKSTSPAIDAWTSVGAASTDYGSNPRPQGKGYDIGPYAYSASLGISPAPIYARADTSAEKVLPPHSFDPEINQPFAGLQIQAHNGNRKSRSRIDLDNQSARCTIPSMF